MPEPRPLKDEINRLMARRGWGRPGGDEALAAAWTDALGSLGQSADGTRTLKLSRHVLHVGVTSPARQGELSGFHADAILAALKERHPTLDVRSLKFQRLTPTVSQTPDEGWME